MKTFRSVHVVLAFLLALALAGCGDQKAASNASAAAKADVIKLAKVLHQPSDFADKTITVNGNFFPACSDTCCGDEFVLRDGISQIKVMSDGKMKMPEMKNAQPITVTGLLKTTAQSPFIEASAIEVR